MIKKERMIIALILLGISAMTFIDIITDTKEGVIWWHVLVESIMATMALIGVFYLIKGTFHLKHQLESEIQLNANLQMEAKKWRDQSKKYFEGLSVAIDQQLSIWDLTNSEKDVAFLLIKGFSLKEIAEIRNTTEKTARTQSTAIYAKAGLSGRSQLAAFFLEDLLLPEN